MESHEDLKSMYAHLDENLSCPICHDTLKENRDLACGHTYCLECVRKLVTINGLTDNIKCCPCQKKTSIPSSGLNGPKQNYKLKCLLEEQAVIMKKIEALFAEQASATPRQEQGTTEAMETLGIFVRDVTGKSHIFNVRLSDTADALKRQIDERTGVPPNSQRLTYQYKELEGSTTLNEYGVVQHSTIHFDILLKGGNIIQ